MTLPANFNQLTEAQQLRLLQERDRNSVRAQAGELVMTTRYDQSGRPIYEFSGPKRSWMAAYMSEARRMVRINKDAPPNPYFMQKG